MELKQKALSEEPMKIVLHGIVIAGEIKKALVNIPMTGVINSRTTLYVEEGDGLEGYKVTSIEPDRLRLDWQGEEMVKSHISSPDQLLVLLASPMQ